MISWRPQEALDAWNAVSPGDRLGPTYGEHVPSDAQGRRSGVLMHPTSLPGPYGIGEMGTEAFKFIDWLVSAGMQARTPDACVGKGGGSLCQPWTECTNSAAEI